MFISRRRVKRKKLKLVSAVVARFLAKYINERKEPQKKKSSNGKKLKKFKNGFFAFRSVNEAIRVVELIVSSLLSQSDYDASRTICTRS